MVRKAYTQEQIINKLREAEVHLSQGSSIGEASCLRNLPNKDIRRYILAGVLEQNPFQSY